MNTDKEEETCTRRGWEDISFEEGYLACAKGEKGKSTKSGSDYRLLKEEYCECRLL